MRKSNLYTYIAAGFIVVLLNGCSDEEDTVASTAASAASAASTSSSSTNLGDSTSTGQVTAGFFLLYDPAIPSVIDSSTRAYTQTDVNITVNAEDVNDLVDLNGQTVNFKTEWGVWLDEKDSCVLANGQCTVIWRSGNPTTVPGSCRVAVTAWTEGAESFLDANDNGLFDASDATFTDLEEPYLDIDSSGSFTAGLISPDLKSELIDITDFSAAGTPKNGIHDLGNGLYDGSLCASGNGLCNTARTSMIIHTRSNILIQTPFDETAADENGNGTPSEKNIVFCGSNLY